MATSKTVSRVSNSNKPDTNKESVSYLVFGTDGGQLDAECYFVVDKEKATVQDIVNVVNNHWEGYPIEHIRVLPFKKSQLKSIKQTLELV
jgi:hypothetical protein